MHQKSIKSIWRCEISGFGGNPSKSCYSYVYMPKSSSLSASAWLMSRVIQIQSGPGRQPKQELPEACVQYQQVQQGHGRILAKATLFMEDGR
jgi:hypothetical protein